MAVYAIAGGGFIKVGFTAGDPEERLAALQTANPHELRLIGISGGSLADEQRIHEMIAGLQVRGEWFVDCPASRTLLTRLLPLGRCPLCRNACSFLAPRYSDVSAGAIGSGVPT